jgi:hypothetical protein
MIALWDIGIDIDFYVYLKETIRRYSSESRCENLKCPKLNFH